jgi:hypothetical protein
VASGNEIETPFPTQALEDQPGLARSRSIYKDPGKTKKIVPEYVTR